MFGYSVLTMKRKKMKCEIFLAILLCTAFSCLQVKNTEDKSEANFYTRDHTSIDNSGTGKKTLYNEYTFGRKEEKIFTAVKIKIDNDGIPKRLHVKDLRTDKVSNLVDIIDLHPSKNNDHNNSSVSGFYYRGHSKQFIGGLYLVGYPKSALEIANMIKKEKVPALLFYPPDQKDNYTGIAGKKLTRSEWTRLTGDSSDATEEELTPELINYFNSNCRDTTGLKKMTFPSDVTVGGRRYPQYAYYFENKNRGCNKHLLHGLDSLDVVKYFQQCNAKCVYDESTRTLLDSIRLASGFSLDFASQEFATECVEDQNKSFDHYAFYVEDGNMHLVNMENGRWQTIKYNCHTNTTELLQ